MTDRDALMDRIIDLQMQIVELTERDRAQAWLDVDLTIQQLKVVFLAVRKGALSAGQIGRELRVGFSTVTGLVDRLVEHGLITRGEDPNDRRATRIVPTDKSRALVENLYAYRRTEFRRLLEHATTESLTALAIGLAGLEEAAHRVAEQPEDTPAS